MSLNVFDLTPQDVLNKIAEWAKGPFAGQSFETVGWDPDRFECKYRRADGRRCFVGVIIPDEVYSKDIEDYSPKNEEVLEVLSLEAESEMVEFLEILQECHDNKRNWSGENREIWKGTINLQFSLASWQEGNNCTLDFSAFPDYEA